MHGEKKFSHVKSSLYRNIAISFIILSIAIAGTIFYVTFSWATIIVSSQKLPFSDNFSLSVSSRPTSFVDGNLKGKVVQTNLDGEGTFTASAKETKTSRARGSVTIVNTTAKAQPLRETTRLLATDGFLFRTESFVTVPARGSVSVPVIADKEGSIEGINLTKFTIPGLWQGLQKDIYGKDFVENVKGVEEVSIVTQNDIDRAKSELTKKLTDKFSLMLDIPDAFFQPLKAVKIFDVKTTEFSSSNAPGDRTKDFTVKLKILGTGIVFDESESMSYIKERAKSQLGIGYEFIFGPEDRSAYSVKGVDAQAGQATIQFDVQAGKVRGQDTSQFIKSNLTGLNKSQIKEYFNSYGDISVADVKFYPFWVQRAPLLTDHIHILFQQ